MVFDPIIASNPIGGMTHLSRICRGLRISVLGVEFGWDAYVLDFIRYGLILGMDWLTIYGAILDFERRVVRLLTCHRKTLEISYDPKRVCHA